MSTLFLQRLYQIALSCIVQNSKLKLNLYCFDVFKDSIHVTLAVKTPIQYLMIMLIWTLLHMLLLTYNLIDARVALMQF